MLTAKKRSWQYKIRIRKERNIRSFILLNAQNNHHYFWGNVSTHNGRLRKPCFFFTLYRAFEFAFWQDFRIKTYTRLSYQFWQSFRIKSIQGFRIILAGFSYQLYRTFVSIFTGLSYRSYRTIVSLLQDYRNVETISVISSQMLLTRFRTEL